MKKLLALSFIGSSLLIGSIPVKADWDYLGVKKNFDYVWEDESKRWLGSPYGIWTLNSQTGEQKLITNFCIEGASCEQRAVSFLETGEWYVQDKGAYDQSTDTWRSHTIDTFNFDAMGFSTVERPILDGLLERNSDGSLQIGLDTDDIDIVSDGLNIDGAAVITKNADGTIQIGTDENDIDITSEGLAIDGEPLITKKANGEFHIGKNSWITKEENGRQKVYAKDANGNSIPIDYTHGTKLLINGRDVEQSINNVGALSAALTGLPTVPTDTTLACGLGTGTHGGDFALSGGCASKVNDKLSINYAASMTMPGQDYAGDFEDTFSARAGFVWKLGKATKPAQISMKDKKVMETKIESLEKKNKTILSKNQKLENKLSILMARLEKIEKIALGESKSKDLATIKLP